MLHQNLAYARCRFSQARDQYKHILHVYVQQMEVARAGEEEERPENEESIPHNYKNNGSKETQNSRNTGLPHLDKYVLTQSGGEGVDRYPSKCI